MLDIAVAVDTDHALDLDVLRNLLGEIARDHRLVAGTLSLAILDDAGMTALNETYLGHAGPTDVLAFALADADEPFSGEVCVNAPLAAREARVRGDTWTRELALYVIHGFLHLLGHDDRSPEQSAAMGKLQESYRDRAFPPSTPSGG